MTFTRIAFLSALTLTSACVVAVPEGGGKVSRDALLIRSPGNFRVIQIAAPIEVHLVEADVVGRNEIGFGCDADVVDDLTIRLDGDTLLIDYDGNNDGDIRDCDLVISGGEDRDVEFEGDEPGRLVCDDEQDVDLNTVLCGSMMLDMTGNSSLHINDLSVRTLDSTQSGTSMLDIDSIEVGTWTAHLQGDSEAMAAGVAEIINVTAEGNATFDTREVEAEEVSITASGDTWVGVTALDFLEVDATGNAHIVILGEPEDTKIDVGDDVSVEGI